MKRTKGVELKSSYFRRNPAPSDESSDALSDNDDESKNNNLMSSGVSNSHSFRTQKSHPHEESKDETENSGDSVIPARSHFSEDDEDDEDIRNRYRYTKYNINDRTEEYKETTALYITNMARLKHIREFKPSPSKFQLIHKKEKAAAAQKIIRGFQSYKETTYENDLLSRDEIPNELEPSSQTTHKYHFYSRQEILKELESISQTAMKNWCFSYSAIYSFIWTKKPHDDRFCKLHHNYGDMFKLKTSDKRIQERLKSIPTRLGNLKLDALLAIGCANCEPQAIILRAYLINTLPPDILKQIGDENIMVAGYKGIDHAFVVIKRFYGKTDQPADCLVIDTWMADSYLPEDRRYRPKAAYPISYQYYRKLLINTPDKKLEYTMATEFPRQGDPNDHKERKPYMGRMQDHFKFLRDHADGYYVPKSFTAGLKLVDITFSILKNADYYNDLYTFLENWEPD